MRIYVVMTSVRPLKVHIYKEGIIRFSTEKYTLGHLNNKFVHLTNTYVYKCNFRSINKFSPSLNVAKAVIGSGSKWTIEKLRSYYKEIGLDFERLWRQIELIIILTLINLAGLVPNTNCCFELFGFDIMVDQH
jgi:tubulin polyglutamylase TTLL2